ncbi:uncharacterized protein C10orf95-like [Pseudopipra pipra]|uniref:uncharacterized protein C10orf95-like n=1 Tax=Pseudopipra pipra TaxID=415032 RepID=UPI003138842F
MPVRQEAGRKLRRGKGERSGAEGAVTSGGSEGRPGRPSLPAGCSLRARGQPGPDRERDAGVPAPLCAAPCSRWNGVGLGSGTPGRAGPRREERGGCPRGAPRHRGPAPRRPTSEGGSRACPPPFRLSREVGGVLAPAPQPAHHVKKKALCQLFHIFQLPLQFEMMDCTDLKEPFSQRAFLWKYCKTKTSPAFSCLSGVNVFCLRRHNCGQDSILLL